MILRSININFFKLFFFFEYTILNVIIDLLGIYLYRYQYRKIPIYVEKLL